jgi:hypothetical protein
MNFWATKTNTSADGEGLDTWHDFKVAAGKIVRYDELQKARIEFTIFVLITNKVND